MSKINLNWVNKLLYINRIYNSDILNGLCSIHLKACQMPQYVQFPNPIWIDFQTFQKKDSMRNQLVKPGQKKVMILHKEGAPPTSPASDRRVPTIGIWDLPAGCLRG